MRLLVHVTFERQPRERVVHLVVAGIAAHHEHDVRGREALMLVLKKLAQIETYVAEQRRLARAVLRVDANRKTVADSQAMVRVRGRQA